MDPMTLDAPIASAEHDARRVSPEPAEAMYSTPGRACIRKPRRLIEAGFNPPRRWSP